MSRLHNCTLVSFRKGDHWIKGENLLPKGRRQNILAYEGDYRIKGENFLPRGRGKIS